MDGQQALVAASFTIAGASSGLIGGFTQLGIGLRAWGSGGGDVSYDLYYDDIVLDNEARRLPREASLKDSKSRLQCAAAHSKPSSAQSEASDAGHMSRLLPTPGARRSVRLMRPADQDRSSRG